MKTTRLPLGLAVSAAFALALASGQGAYAQQPPAQTIAVPVTFYDFHSDRTNPEFEQPHSGALRRGMVANTLDKDHKPVVGSSPYLNQGIRFWFRDWSKLNDGTYQMQAENDPDSRYSTRGYLEKFRPIYMYYDNSTFPPGRRQRFGDEWGSRGYLDSNIPRAYPNSTVAVNNYTNIATQATGFTGNGQYYTIDSAYINRVVYDTLIFNHIGNGTYTFDRDNNNQFFPLNGRGFQANNNTANNWIYDSSNGGNRNYSYTMELVWGESKYDPTANMNFTFRGDDDVWVFINDRLVMDIGGIHQPENGTFNLDQLVRNGTLNLTAGEKFDMRLFYCERHANDANIRITTNIIGSQPKELFINVSGDTLTAGVPILADGLIYDDDGQVIKNYRDRGGVFTWSAREVAGNLSTATPSTVYNNPNRTPPGSAIFDSTATEPSGANSDLRIWRKNTPDPDTVKVAANKAYTWIMLVGRYCEETCVSDTAWLYVKPGAAANVFIEASAAQPGNTSPNLRNPAPLPYVTLTSSDLTNESFYAILRDAYGNWIGPASNGSATNPRNTWSAARPTVATVGQGTNPNLGQGKATRVSDRADTTVFTLLHQYTTTQSFTASSVIRIQDVEYIGIRVGVKVGGTFYEVPGDSILVYIPGDTTIYVQMRRSDNLVWEDAPANWTTTAITGTGPGAIPAGPSYTYTPTGPANILFIARTPNGDYADTIRVRSDYRTPLTMRFFNRTGAPTNLNDTTAVYPPADANRLYRYPVPNATITVRAGVSMPIVAAMFGTNLPAINSYIPTASLPAGFTVSWSIVGSTDTTTVKGSTTDRSQATFRSTVAHQVYVVRAAYIVGTDTLVRQDLRVQVVPGAPHAVYIEPESQDLTQSSLNTPLTFSGRFYARSATGAITLPLLPPLNGYPQGDTLALASSETTRQAYALLRDEWGNYIAPSGGYSQYLPAAADIKATTWAPTGTQTVNAVAGNASTGQGTVTRDTAAKNGTFVVTAKDETFLGANVTAPRNPASLYVTLLGYSYTELRVVDPDGRPLDSVHTNTNDTTTRIIVQGKRTDCDDGKGGPTGEACWEEVTGVWGTDNGLTSSLIPPPPGSSWTLIPLSEGGGNIIVSRQGVDGDGNPTTIRVELPTVIDLGPPTSAELVIITPADSIIAGEPIKAEVRYYNRTGILTSWNDSWTSTAPRATFADNQGLNGTTWEPTVASDCDTNTLGYLNHPSGPNACLTPTYGRDTVTFVLYNATNNPHTLTYAETIMGIPLTASATLTLQPADPFRVVIVDANGRDLPNDTTFDHNTATPIILQTVGEDRFGNRTGAEGSTWCVTDTIPASGATCEGTRTVIIYDPTVADRNGCGSLIASPSGNIIADTLNICIVNVSIKPQRAFTRDFHGCGYINRIEIQFEVNVQAQKAFNRLTDNSLISLRNGTTTFTVDTVTYDGRTVWLWLNDNEFMANKTALQTDWTPTLTVSQGLIKDVQFSNITVQDGVAPVIKTAVRYFHASEDRSLDYVDVTFSEKVGPMSKAHGAIELKDLFRVWAQTQTNGVPKVRAKKLSKSAKTAGVDANTYTELQGVLDGIVGVTPQGSANTMFRFILSNGFDLKKDLFLNIWASHPVTSVSSEIRDVPSLSPANVPDTNNRRVPITYGNDKQMTMVPVPNPASPDRTPVGNMVEMKTPHTQVGAYDNPEAINWIKNGGGGVVFRVPVYIPDDVKTSNSVGSGGAIGDGRGSDIPGKVNIRCQVKVYDLAGNLVSSGETKNLLNVNRSTLATDPGDDVGTSDNMDLFWSGFNSKGMKSAPGTYKMIVQISYTGTKDPNAKNQKYTGTVGIAK